MNDIRNVSYMHSVEYIFGKYLMTPHIKSRQEIVVLRSKLEQRPKDTTSCIWSYRGAIFPTKMANEITIAAIFNEWLKYNSVHNLYRARSKDSESLDVIHDILKEAFDVETVIYGGKELVLRKKELEILMFKVVHENKCNFLKYLNNDVRETLMRAISYDDKLYEGAKEKIQALPTYIPKVMKEKKTTREDFLTAPMTDVAYKLTAKQQEQMNQINIYYGNRYIAEGCVVNGVVVDERKYLEIRAEYLEKKKRIEEGTYKEEEKKIELFDDGFAKIDDE